MDSTLLDDDCRDIEPLPADALADLTAALRGIRKLDRLVTAVQTGKLIIDSLFGGDLHRWRARARADTYTTLESHAELPMSAADLYRSVRAYELCERFPWLLTSKLFTLSHVTELFVLDETTQAALLSEARERRWTVRRLRKAVHQATVARSSTGRPRTSQALKTVTRLLNADSAFDGMDSLLSLDPSTAQRLLASCERARKELERAEELLNGVAARRKGPRAQILLVDPDPVFVTRAQSHLRRQRYAVRTATTCKEALGTLEPRTRCAVIAMALPDGSGVDLSTQMRAALPSLHCVLTTVRHHGAFEIRECPPVVRKTSGLLELRIELAKALLGAP